MWTSDDINAPVMGCDGPKRGHWGSVRSQVFRHGPYVHLEQFMEEVEYRTCRRRFPVALSTLEAAALAMQELVKEITEGKA